MARGDRVRTALLLAAGIGSRLSPLTSAAPKCLTEVNGVPILKQQVACLERWGFEELIVVLGHQGDQIRDFLSDAASDLKVTYVHNPRYRTTNNLYSLWLARTAVERPFLLLECDLFFESGLLSGMLRPDGIALATRRPWMHGTSVALDDSQRVAKFQLGGDDTRAPLDYKTVNIHSLSLSTWQDMRHRLDAYVASGRVNDYYEAVFRDMTVDGTFKARAVSFDEGKWYEVDTLDDLRAAEKLFAHSRSGEAQDTRFAGDAGINGAPPAREPRHALRSASEAPHG